MTLHVFSFGFFETKMCTEILQMWNGSVSTTGLCQLYWWGWMELLGPGFWLALHMGWMSGGCSFWQWPPHSYCLWWLGGIWPLHFAVLFDKMLHFICGHWHWHWPRTCFLCQVASRICTVAPGQWKEAWCSSVYHEMCKDEQQRRGNGKRLTGGAFQQCLFFCFVFCILCVYLITISSKYIWTRKRMPSLIIVCPSMSQTLISKAKEEKETGTDKNYTFIDIFRTPNIRKLSIYLGLVW